MAIISAHQALYEYIYSEIGNTISEGGDTFNYFVRPPENQTTPYIWLNIQTLSDDGPRDGFIYNLFAEFTVVTFEDVNRPSNSTLLNGELAILKLFTTRGLNLSYTSSGGVINIISQTLSSIEEGAENLAQKKIIFAKVNVNFTVSF